LNVESEPEPGIVADVDHIMWQCLIWLSTTPTTHWGLNQFELDAFLAAIDLWPRTAKLYRIIFQFRSATKR